MTDQPSHNSQDPGRKWVFPERAWAVGGSLAVSEFRPSVFIFFFFNSSTHESIHRADLNNSENSLFEWGRGYRNSEKEVLG